MTHSEQQISLSQTWHGKKVGSLTAAERMAMESEMGRAGIKDITYTNDSGKTGEVAIPTHSAEERRQGDAVPSKNKTKCSITIGSRHYNSWAEVAADKTNPAIHNYSNVTRIRTVNGRLMVNGREECCYNDHTVVVVVNGNVSGNVDAGEGSVNVYGNVTGDVTAQMGSIHAETIEGDAHASMGSIRATTIKGSAKASMGNIYRQG